MSSNLDSLAVLAAAPSDHLKSHHDRLGSAEEAITKYGLDWQVSLAPVLASSDPLGVLAPVPRARAVVRMDTKQPLSVVGNRFQPIQNREAFGFFDTLVGHRKATYETAGSCDGGRRVWIQAKLPGDMWITKQDNVEKYLLLTMLHGGGSLWVMTTPRRVWCQNMLHHVLEEGKSSAIRIRHVGDIGEKVREAERLLGLSAASFDVFMDQARSFAGRMIKKEALGAYFETLVPNPKDGDPSRAIATREAFMRLFESGKGNDLPTVRGTLWAALNGVIEYVDHERTTRVRPGQDEASGRFKSAQFGSGAALKERAWRGALALLG